jgi:hypothetical protein
MSLDCRELHRRPSAFDEVSDYAGDQNENEQRQKPGPPAVSCEQHINLRCGLGPSRSGQCSSIYLKAEKWEALAWASVPECHQSAR